MSVEDSNNLLDDEEEPFSYRKFKNGKVSITWNDREVLILKGNKADKFLSQIESANRFETQLVIAKITGNFKRGNEREAKLKSK